MNTVLKNFTTLGAVIAKGGGQSVMQKLSIIRYGLVLGVILGLTSCCGPTKTITTEAMMTHDILTDIVTITDIKYDEKGKPVVDLYITNPHNYKLNVYQVDTQNN